MDSTRVNHARHRDAAPTLLWMKKQLEIVQQTLSDKIKGFTSEYQTVYCILQCVN